MHGECTEELYGSRVKPRLLGAAQSMHASEASCFAVTHIWLRVVVHVPDSDAVCFPGLRGDTVRRELQTPLPLQVEVVRKPTVGRGARGAALHQAGNFLLVWRPLEGTISQHDIGEHA
jgi:hypothetical protein